MSLLYRFIVFSSLVSGYQAKKEDKRQKGNRGEEIQKRRRGEVEMVSSFWGRRRQESAPTGAVGCHESTRLVLSLTCCVLLLLVEIRWEEERYTDGSKWRFLEHKGPVFAPQYEPLPDKVKFYYDGESVLIRKSKL